jgi:anti-sigma factor RsiW
VQELLDAYVDGGLGVGDAAAVEDHLASCAVCGAELERARQLCDELRRLPELRAPSQVLESVKRSARERSWTWPSWSSLAAAAVLVAAGGVR